MLNTHKTNASKAYAILAFDNLRSNHLKVPRHINLVIPCPGKLCNPDVTYEWMCLYCKNYIKYGFNDKLYCLCGSGDANTCKFKCIDEQHGGSFDSFEDKNYFNYLVSQLKPLKEKNILILGETGVGKSTWINAFLNYLSFSSLDEAKSNDLLSLIPSQFSLYDENYIEVKITTGTDVNEAQVIGQSATQKTKIYSFMIGDTKIRLIDTPGVGDTRGIEQDKLNFEDILSTLSYLDKLHGICILLKPSESRLSVMFEFCIKELLYYLHKDACRNIVFCFTNTRQNFYQPGGTVNMLKELLHKNKLVDIPICKKTMYCFDSESYRYLAAVKSKTESLLFLENLFNNYAESWEHSVSETKRLLQHITGLKAHKLNNTLSLNAARVVIQQLTRPLTEISKNMQGNKEILKNNIANLDMVEVNIKNLEKQKFFEKLVLEITNIDEPKTVCTNISCKKLYNENGLMQIHYSTVCHNNCTIRSVNHDTVGDNKILGCSAFNVTIVDAIANTVNYVFNIRLPFTGLCRQCNHSYKEHMHIYYESKEVLKIIERLEVVEMLKSKLSELEKKEMVIKHLKNEINELDKESNYILESSAKFESFLKNSAITQYNDATLRYLDYLIKEETDKVNNGSCNKTLNSLNNMRNTYKEKSNNLESSGDTNVVNVSEIQSRIDKLYNLKHSGEYLQKSRLITSCTHKLSANNQEIPAELVVNENRSRFKRLTDWTGEKIKQFIPAIRY
ncbi:uncharacterized protein LOC100209799 [Hydra vulgaris]|uniref:uncharacterized protein LOC100209799 n=1 Tax=Hydra vulgaris TaxID=6087 RepID=UPI0032E9DD19